MSQGVTAARFTGPMPDVEDVWEVRRRWSKQVGSGGSAGLEGHGTGARGCKQRRQRSEGALLGLLHAGPGRSGLRSRWLKRVSSHGEPVEGLMEGLIRKQLEGGQRCRQCLAGVAGQPDNLDPK